MRILIILLGLFILIFSACDKDMVDKTYDIHQNKSMNIDPTYDNQMRKLSYIFNIIIVEHPVIRQIIKERALQMFDGDYDILMSDLINVEIPTEGNQIITIGEIINSYYSNSDVNEIINGETQDIENINSLLDLYPYLQVSVPVHCEDWDEVNYIPEMVFIPSDFDEAGNINIEGYKNDQLVTMDGINSPEMPVIVLGISERVGDPKPVLGGPTQTITLSGSTMESGIKLLWTLSNVTTPAPSIDGYNIYRKGTTDQSFQLIGIIYGESNTIFFDNYPNIEPVKTYAYKVEAFNADGVSPLSNMVVITSGAFNPSSNLTFSVQQKNSNYIESRWTYDFTQSAEGMELSRNINGQNGYSVINNFSLNQSEYFDYNFIKGKTITYKARTFLGSNFSNPKYDFIKVPYRDPSVEEPVYVSQIYVEDLSGVESWVYGKPEFKLFIGNGKAQASNTNLISTYPSIFNFNQRNNTCTDATAMSNYIFRWMPEIWLDAMSFMLVEYDRVHIDFDGTLTAKYKTKNADSTNFGVDGSVGITVKYNDDDENCGTSYYYYWENNVDYVLDFPSYGAKIVLTNSLR